MCQRDRRVQTAAGPKDDGIRTNTHGMMPSTDDDHEFVGAITSGVLIYIRDNEPHRGYASTLDKDLYIEVHFNCYTPYTNLGKQLFFLEFYSLCYAPQGPSTSITNNTFNKYATQLLQSLGSLGEILTGKLIFIDHLVLTAKIYRVQILTGQLSSSQRQSESRLLL